MFALVDRPQTLQAEELDHYLEHGWFRMGQTIFTTSFLNFKNQFYDAIWLRVDLKYYTPEKRFHRLRKINESFEVVIRPASLDSEREELFLQYKESVSFETSPSLRHLLYGKSPHLIYNSYEINLYDNQRLIAVGIFDLGKESAAGITSFYDPSYKKYSLGKYLIYLKIDYCHQLGLHFFYPGYFVPGYSPFNYKLEIGKSALQYLDIKKNAWRPIESFVDDQTPLRVMWSKLLALQKQLMEGNIVSKIFRYEFFDANLIPELQGAGLFDYPVFLYIKCAPDADIQPLVVYDIKSQTYRLLECVGIWTPDEVPHNNHDLFSFHVLKQQQELIADADVLVISATVQSLNQQNVRVN